MDQQATRLLQDLGDREFVGKDWFHYLKMNKIPFLIRIKSNFLITNSQSCQVNAWQLFFGLNKEEKRILAGEREILGLKFNVAGVRCCSKHCVVLVFFIILNRLIMGGCLMAKIASN